MWTGIWAGTDLLKLLLDLRSDRQGICDSLSSCAQSSIARCPCHALELGLSHAHSYCGVDTAHRSLNNINGSHCQSALRQVDGASHLKVLSELACARTFRPYHDGTCSASCYAQGRQLANQPGKCFEDLFAMFSVVHCRTQTKYLPWHILFDVRVF